jgi:hypothetical protein
MTHTATAMATTMNQHIRNQLSLMAWVAAGLCGWVMFLAVHSLACNDCDAAQPAAYSNAHTAAQK